MNQWKCRYTFRLVTTDKPDHWSLHDHIKRHFKAYDAHNLNEALRQLAENLLSEFGLVETYEIHRLGKGGWQINIGSVLVVKFTWDAYVLPSPAHDALSPEQEPT